AAAGEPPRDAARDPRKVAIVGYFLDRNEDDHLGNVAEIRRLLAALDLDLVTVWLEGTPTADLARVAEAGTILSLPHGRAAAEVLAGRTGARLVPCEVPFGIDATARFLRTAAAACGGGREEAAESLIRAELARCMPRLRWLVPKRLAHGRWAFAGDPALIPGLCEIASLVGARVDLAVAWTHRPPETLWDPAPPPATEVVVLHDQNAGALRETLEARADRIDLLIGNHHVVLEHLLPNSLGFLEFGFPSLIHHGIGDDPFLGYRGFLRFLSRIADQFYDWDLEFEEVDV
ncbi:MAG: hypothetical protein FJ087_11650, partial [Deltaproteobacteria bacterium]|nr:hypothetical protein [Deltaproteobacteria bacterium]